VEGDRVMKLKCNLNGKIDFTVQRSVTGVVILVDDKVIFVNDKDATTLASYILKILDVIEGRV
jgi:hypothetical protein